MYKPNILYILNMFILSYLHLQIVIINEPLKKRKHRILFSDATMINARASRLKVAIFQTLKPRLC